MCIHAHYINLIQLSVVCEQMTQRSKFRTLQFFTVLYVATCQSKKSNRHYIKSACDKYSRQGFEIYDKINIYAMYNIRSFSIDFLIAFYACYLIRALSDFWSLRLTQALSLAATYWKGKLSPWVTTWFLRPEHAEQISTFMQNIIACSRAKQDCAFNETHTML